MMFLLTCDKKITKSQLSPTHASTKRKITDELKHNAKSQKEKALEYKTMCDRSVPCQRSGRARNVPRISRFYRALVCRSLAIGPCDFHTTWLETSCQ